MQLTQAYDLDEILSRPQHEMGTQHYDLDDQAIVIYHGNPDDVSDPYVFYIQCIAKVLENTDKVKDFLNTETVAKHVSKDDFLKFVDERFRVFKVNEQVQLKGIFIDSMLFEENSENISFICETTEEMLFFNWRKTS